MWHPLRLAENYAMANILTGGQVIFGVACGDAGRRCRCRFSVAPTFNGCSLWGRDSILSAVCLAPVWSGLLLSTRKTFQLPR
jgi:hypothetical protein